MAVREQLLECMTLVQVTLEIPLRQPFPSDATIELVHRTAAREALDKVRRLDGHPFAVVGDPVVQIVTTKKGKE